MKNTNCHFEDMTMATKDCVHGDEEVEKETQITFTGEQLKYLAKGICFQMNNLGFGDTMLKNILAKTLTKILKAMERTKK